MGNLVDLLLFFMFYSFFGWTMETVFASIKERKVVNRGFLTGFICPIYGCGAVLILQSSKIVSALFENTFFAYIFAMLVAVVLVTILEYITGCLLDKIFDRKWWDYSEKAFNLSGYICLKYSLLWGILAVLLIEVLHPAVSGWILSTPVTIKKFLAVFLLLYLLADTIYSAINALGLRKESLSYPQPFYTKRFFEKIIKSKRFFLSFPRKLILNSTNIDRDIRSVLNDKMDKIQDTLKNRHLK